MGKPVITTEQAQALAAVYAEGLARRQAKRGLIGIQVTLILLIVAFALIVTALVAL